MKDIMSLDLSVKHITFHDGERHKLLVDSAGIPLYFPSLYITSHIRGGGHSVSTIQSVLTSLKVLYFWLDYNNMDIESRFRKANLLKPYEIASLCDFVRKPLSKNSAICKMQRINNSGRDGSERKDRVVMTETAYTRMTNIASYLKFLAEILAFRNDHKGIAERIEAMTESIAAHRPRKKQWMSIGQEDKGLGADVVEKIFECLQLGNKKNPFKNDGVQFRNLLIVSLLLNLGIRRGELLNLRVDDIDFTANELCIIRRPDSDLDKRKYQPLVKTLPRKLIISPQLAHNLNRYILNYRSKLLGARRHPYLFVSHKVGPLQGYPLSNSGFGKLMSILQHVLGEGSGVHAHAFRHTWNYEFSSLLDRAELRTSPEKEEQMRSYLMGWSESSGTAAIYNRRHIKEKAKEASLHFQMQLNKKGNWHEE